MFCHDNNLVICSAHAKIYDTRLKITWFCVNSIFLSGLDILLFGGRPPSLSELIPIIFNMKLTYT